MSFSCVFQYDWCSWIPNSPSTMRKPPPSKKGVADVQLIIDSLPDRGRSCWHLGAVWALSQFQENEVNTHKHSLTVGGLAAQACIVCHYSRTISQLHVTLGMLSPAGIPGHVHWRALHREACKRCHEGLQKEAGRHHQHHQEAEWGEEAALLLPVTWQNSLQCRCLRERRESLKRFPFFHSFHSHLSHLFLFFLVNCLERILLMVLLSCLKMWKYIYFFTESEASACSFSLYIYIFTASVKKKKNA